MQCRFVPKWRLLAHLSHPVSGVLAALQHEILAVKWRNYVRLTMPSLKLSITNCICTCKLVIKDSCEHVSIDFFCCLCIQYFMFHSLHTFCTNKLGFLLVFWELFRRFLGGGCLGAARGRQTVPNTKKSHFITVFWSAKSIVQSNNSHIWVLWEKIPALGAHSNTCFSFTFTAL